MSNKNLSLPEGVQLGASPLSWTNDVLEDLGGDISLETCLSDAAAVGYEGVELGRKFPRDPAVLGPLLAEYGLALASGWHSGRLAEGEVAAERAAVSAHAALLRDLGAKVMVYGETAAMAPGNPLDVAMSGRVPLASLDAAAYALRLDEFSRWLFGEYGLKLAYHHHLMMVAETFDEVSALFDRTSPKTGLLLDTGHAAAGGFDYPRLIERFGDRIVHIHLKDVRPDILARTRAEDLDFNTAVRAGLFTVPGGGMLDFAPVAAFVRSGWQGWLVVEAEQDPALAPPRAVVARAYADVTSLFA